MSSEQVVAKQQRVIFSHKDAKKLNKKVCNHLQPFGFECRPFLVQWYNDLVADRYKLKHVSGDTLALCVISNADMYRTMLQMKRNPPLNLADKFLKDPVHTTTRYYLQQAVNSKLIGQDKSHLDAEVIHDFDLQPNRMPKVLVQTAGHVSGIAYYYQPKNGDPADCKVGVAIHKNYGGWFGFRGIILLKNVSCADLKHKNPVDVVGVDTEKRIELLQLFGKWDWAFRDIVPVTKRYSKVQAYFFLAPPDKRVLNEEE